MTIFKTPYLCNDIVSGIIDNLNKKLVNGIAVYLDIFGNLIFKNKQLLLAIVVLSLFNL